MFGLSAVSPGGSTVTTGFARHAVLSHADEIVQGLEQKLEAMLRRDLYAKYKTALTGEEREIARREYLDWRGVSESFRW